MDIRWAADLIGQLCRGAKNTISWIRVLDLYDPVQEMFSSLSSSSLLGQNLF